MAEGENKKEKVYKEKCWRIDAVGGKDNNRNDGTDKFDRDVFFGKREQDYYYRKYGN